MPARAQRLDAAARNAARIANGGHDARDARGDDGVGTRRRLAVVRARLERDVQRRAARAATSRAQRIDLGVRLAESRVKPLADDLTAGNDDGADHWVRRRLSPSGSASASARRMYVASTRVWAVSDSRRRDRSCRYQLKRDPSRAV